MAAPNLEAEKTSFIIKQNKSEEWYSEFTESSENSESSERSENSKRSQRSKNSERSENSELSEHSQPARDDFDLSDITHQPVEQDREDIIAAAEAAAFAEKEE